MTFFHLLIRKKNMNKTIPVPPLAPKPAKVKDAAPTSPWPASAYNWSTPDNVAPQLKVVDLGKISPDKFQDIIDQISKSWGTTVAPIINQPPTFKNQLKSDLVNASYRVGSAKLLSATKSFFMQYIRKSYND